MEFGVDEAGKGPVLGSMFAAAVVAEAADLPDGVADSKTLAPERRFEIAAALEADPDVAIGIGEMPVARIDDPETNMNTLTVEVQARALSQVDVAGLEGYVDAGDTNAERFGRRVADRVAGNPTIHAEHRADETYPVVAAASIVAKVHRDAHVEALAAEYDADVGSGYPSDARTRAFLESYLETTGELPACARASWQTSKDLLESDQQRGLGEF